MDNAPEAIYSFAPELPEFEKLGRRFFPNVTVEEFWMILFTIEQGGLATVEELPWVEGIPAGFRTLFAAPLQFWEAFAWENVRCGLLRHNLTGFCRPVITDPEGDRPFVASETWGHILTFNICVGRLIFHHPGQMRPHPHRPPPPPGHQPSKSIAP